MKQWCGDISCSRKGSQTNIVKAEPQPGHTLDFSAAPPDDPGSILFPAQGLFLENRARSRSLLAPCLRVPSILYIFFIWPLSKWPRLHHTNYVDDLTVSCSGKNHIVKEVL